MKPFEIIKFKRKLDITSLGVMPFVIVEKVEHVRHDHEDSFSIERNSKVYYRKGDDLVFKTYNGTVDELLESVKEELTSCNKSNEPALILWERGTVMFLFYKGETLNASYNLVLKNWVGDIMGADIQFIRGNKVALCYDFITYVNINEDQGE